MRFSASAKVTFGSVSVVGLLRRPIISKALTLLEEAFSSTEISRGK